MSRLNSANAQPVPAPNKGGFVVSRKRHPTMKTLSLTSHASYTILLTQNIWDQVEKVEEKCFS